MRHRELLGDDGNALAGTRGIAFHELGCVHALQRVKLCARRQALGHLSLAERGREWAAIVRSGCYLAAA